MANSEISMRFEELHGMLEPVIKDCLKEYAPSTSASKTVEALEMSDTGPVFDTLNRLIGEYTERTDNSRVTGIPLPEVDAELLPLQKEIEVILQRLCTYRKQVPELMAAAVEQQLAELRPKLDVALHSGALMPEMDALPSGSDLEYAQRLQQLHDTMAASLGRMPGLRARLEAVEGRLSRNMAAVMDGKQQQQAGTPCTVEKVFRAAPDGGAKA